MVFLIVLCFFILVELLKCIVEFEVINNLIFVFIVGVVGLFVNVFGLVFFYWYGYGYSYGGSGYGYSNGSVNVVDLKELF